MDNAFKRHVKADLTICGNTLDDLAKAAGVHVNTLRRHLDEPDLMTRHEMAVMSGYVSRATILMICPWWKEDKP